MRQLCDYSDDRMRGSCIYCGRSPDNNGASKDHVPSKCLLEKPYPVNLTVVKVCKSCNEGFAKDEEYVTAFLASVISGSTRPDAQQFPSAAKTLEHQRKLRKRIELTRREQFSMFDGSQVVWTPEIERIKRVLVKNARGHIRWELGMDVHDPPSHIAFVPLQSLSTQARQQFENGPASQSWPEVGNRWMQRIVEGECDIGGWLEVQSDVYRFAIDDPATVRMVLREYLAVEIAWEL